MLVSPLTDISAPEILALARIHEKSGALETAHRCIHVIGQVFRYGMAVGVVFSDYNVIPIRRVKA
ncbi:MAG: phage integrase central domain-containing protein [Methylohalobius sp. ZOD2]|nr:hypothetical protein [Methylothermaceae bacterium]